MKKKILYSLLIVAISAVSAKAQTGKGYMMVGTDFTNLHVQEGLFAVNATPGIAWFVKDGLALGGRVTLGYDKQSGADGQFNYGIAPLVRGYFGGSETNKFFGQLAVGYQGATNNGAKFWHASPALGYNYFFNKHVALELAAQYTYVKVKQQDGAGMFDLTFGLQVFLPGKGVKDK